MTTTTVFRSGALFSAATGHRPGWGAVVRDGRITRIGPDADLPRPGTPGVTTVDLAGGLLSPGFHDAHCHPVQAGVELGQCDLTGADTVRECLDRVAAHARADPEAPWIVGGGWSMDLFPGGAPTRDLLDAVVPDRPVHLENRDHHGAWVNSAALALAGVGRGTPDPRDGRIERTPDGTPSGTLHEGAARLTGDLRPPVDRATALAGLLRAQQHLVQLGVTGWQDAYVMTRADGDDVDVYRTAAVSGALRARVSAALWWDRERGLEQLPDLLARLHAESAARRPGPAGHVHLGTVKIMVDGVAENFTAALTEPYLDRCGHPTTNRGLSFVDPHTLAGAVTALDAAGVQVHFHALGDRAVREALDAVQAARTTNGPHGPRHHLAHLQVVHPDDVPRFARLRASANLQPLWACPEPQMLDLTLPFMPAAAAVRQYPFGDLHAASADLVCGSDWPVSSADPLAALEVAVTRRVPGAPADAPALSPHQGLTLATAWTAYTAGSARVGGWGDVCGDLVPGLAGDLVVLDRDPFAGPAHRIADSRVVSTWIAGEPVHHV